MPPAILEIVARLFLSTFKQSIKDWLSSFLSQEQKILLKEKTQFIKDTAEFVNKNKAFIQHATPQQITKKLQEHLLTNSPSAQRINEHVKDATKRFNEFVNKIDIRTQLKNQIQKGNKAFEGQINKIFENLKMQKITANDLGGYLISTWVDPSSYFIAPISATKIIEGQNTYGFFVLKTLKGSKDYYIPMSTVYMLAMSTKWHTPDGGGAGSFLWEHRVTPHFTMKKQRRTAEQRYKATQAKRKRDNAKMQQIRASREAVRAFKRSQKAQGGK